MKNSVNQNPANKVGRNSGGGPAGVDRYIPTEREAAHGLRGQEGPSGGRLWRGWSATLGLVAAAAASTGYYFIRDRQQKRSGWRGKLRKMLPWK
jgi:hypothetical protein